MKLFSKRTSITVSPTSGDRGRKYGPFVTLAFACVTGFSSFLSYRFNNETTLIAFLYFTSVFLHYTLSAFHMKAFMRRGRTYWTLQERQVTMRCPTFLAAYETSFSLLTSLTGPLAVFTWSIHTRGDWIGPAALFILVFKYPPNPRKLRLHNLSLNRITIDRNGIQFTQFDGHTDSIPWRAHPRLARLQQGIVVISFRKRRELKYPISFLPLTFRQFERLLNTFTTDGQLRAKLSGPDALSAVLAVLEPTEEERTDGSWTWYSI